MTEDRGTVIHSRMERLKGLWGEGGRKGKRKEDEREEMRTSLGSKEDE